MKKLYISLVILLFSGPLFAQDWITMMKDHKTNVHDVQKAFYAWYSTHKEPTDKKSADKEKEDGNYQLFKRWEWLMETRTFPSGNRPDPTSIARQYQEFVKSKATDRIANITSLANWTYVGNDSVPPAGPNGNYKGGDGRVNYFRFMPGNSNTIFACGPTGGLWETTNGGKTWSTKTDNLPDMSVSDVAIDPTNTNIMYISTGDGDGIMGGYTTLSTVGVLKSTDGGTTWSPTGLSFPQATTGPQFSTVNQLLIHPVSTNILLAGTSFGLYRTTNGGTTWTQVDTGDFRSLECEYFHPNIMFAGTFNGQYYRSTNAGATWTLITAGLPTGYVAQQRVKIAVTPADSLYVYVLEWQSGVYRSTDGGKTFTTQTTTDNIGGQGWYNLGFNVSQTNRDSLLCGGLDIYASPDGGVSWNLTAEWTNTGAPYVHADVHCISWLPGSGATYFASSDGGFFRQDMANTSIWQDLSNNLGIGELYCVGPSAKTPNLWITGWQDNGVNISAPFWEQVYGGDGMISFIDYSNDNTWYAENYGGDFQISTNAGATWNSIGPSYGPWVTRWMQDPMNANTLYGGYSNLWESNNQGTSWNPITSWGSSSSDISAIAVDASNDNIIYTANAGQIERTSNNGTSWIDITPGLPVTSAGITGIALNPANPAHAWVTFSGYVSGDKVFVTTDSGATWTNISAGLPNLPVNCILFQPGSNEGIYVGTDAGVYYRDNLLGAWISYNTGLPNVIINDLKYTAAPGTIIAATYGRGVWSSPAYVTGINELSADNYMKVYPNPTDGKLYLELSLPVNGEYNVTVSNLLGQNLVNNKITVQGHYKGTIDLSNYGRGTYILTIKGQGYESNKKVVVN